MDKLDVEAPAWVDIKPKRSANVLFHFTKELKHLKTTIQRRGLASRYCEEDIEFLGLEVNGHTISKVAYPEKCFCDIPIHNIYRHAEQYGACAIGLTKKWGIENGIQPIQYVNPNSNLIKDFRLAFHKGLEIKEDDTVAQFVSNFLISYMLYIKPLKGLNRSRVTDEYEPVYLTDECEWRFIPDLTEQEMEPVLYDHEIRRKDANSNYIKDKYTDALDKLEDTWLKFSYEDVRYLSVKNSEQRNELIEFILSLEDSVTHKEKMELISKIVVLDEAQEDF